MVQLSYLLFLIAVRGINQMNIVHYSQNNLGLGYRRAIRRAMSAVTEDLPDRIRDTWIGALPMALARA